ncbi:MAG: nicotinate-nucleotide adenylyltransferase [Gemmatales bacterium]
MRIGIFGGSFDPVHNAHLMLAEQCREQGQLDRLLFIPAPRPPHKHNSNVAGFDDRVAMLRLAIAGNPQFELDTCEQDRPGLSYTVDTLRYLHQRDPGNEWLLILGGDSVRDLELWREPHGIASQCKLLIVQRPGVQAILPPDYFHYQIIDSPLIDISSTAIRNKLAAGQSIRYLVPAAVEEYIRAKKLYL